MVNKDLRFGTEARNSMLIGIEKLSAAVKSTLGPRGKNVIIEGPENALPLITKDGVTVAKQIKLKDSYENLGAEMVREVASKTNTVAGDGTTTATVLAEAIYKEGLKNVAAGANPTLVKRGIDKAVTTVVDALKVLSTPVQTKEDIKQIATISANGDEEVGNILADAMERVGNDGTITVEEGRGIDTTLTVVEGMQFNRGYLSSHFINNPANSECVLINPYILVYENKLTNIQAVLPFLQKVGKACKENNRPVLLIADDYEAEVLTTLVVNKIRGSLNVCVVKSPAFGADKTAILEDLAILTGAIVAGDTVGKKIENVDVSDLGSANKVIISKDSTTIIGGKGDIEKIQGRVSHLQNLINSDGGYDIVKLRDRVSKLSGGVAIISVGGCSELEVREKYHRVEDALHATRAAVSEGIVAGGGTALVCCISSLDGASVSGDEAIGFDIIRRALIAPAIQIVDNAGLGKGAVVVEKIIESNGKLGYDALNGEYCNMIERGIIDPVKVTRSALQNAASISGLLLTTNCCIINSTI